MDFACVLIAHIMFIFFLKTNRTLNFVVVVVVVKI